jgi:hypothetical protein
MRPGERVTLQDPGSGTFERNVLCVSVDRETAGLTVSSAIKEAEGLSGRAIVLLAYQEPLGWSSYLAALAGLLIVDPLELTMTELNMFAAPNIHRVQGVLEMGKGRIPRVMRAILEEGSCAMTVIGCGTPSVQPWADELAALAEDYAPTVTLCPLS